MNKYKTINDKIAKIQDNIDAMWGEIRGLQYRKEGPRSSVKIVLMDKKGFFRELQGHYTPLNVIHIPVLKEGCKGCGELTFKFSYWLEEGVKGVWVEQ